MESKSNYSVIKRLGAVSDSGVIMYNLERQEFNYFNENFLNIFAISKESIDKDPLILLSRIVPEDLEHLQTRYNHMLCSWSHYKYRIFQ